MDLNQAAYGVTQAVIATFKDSKQPNLGLSAFFPNITTRAKQVSIAVRRSRQLVAVDVLRATSSNRNIFSKYSQKLFLSPFYNEAFDFTSTEVYDNTFGMGVAPTGPQIDIMVQQAADYMLEVKYKIMRAIEQQRASVLQTGTVTVKNGDSLDYGRQSASMPVLTGAAAWTQPTTANPLGDLAAGGKFLRQQGLSTGNEINVVMGDNVLGYLTAFPTITSERQIFANFRRADIGMPVLNTVTGMTFVGRIATGDFIFNLWTYSDFYENADGSKSKYIADNMVILIPNDFEGSTTYAGIPMVMGNDNGGRFVAPVETDFMVYDIIDPQKKSWDMITESAPLVIPFSVDRLYSIQVA